MCNVCCNSVCLEPSIGLDINNDQEWNTNNLHNPLPEEQQMIFWPLLGINLTWAAQNRGNINFYSLPQTWAQHRENVFGNLSRAEESCWMENFPILVRTDNVTYCVIYSDSGETQQHHQRYFNKIFTLINGSQSLAVTVTKNQLKAYWSLVLFRRCYWKEMYTFV